MLAPRGFEPKRKPRDFDRLGIEVDAIEIAGDDFVERIEIDRLTKVGKMGYDAPVFRGEQIEGGDEKSARPAGRVDNCQIAKCCEIIAPEQPLGIPLGLRENCVAVFLCRACFAVPCQQGGEALGQGDADRMLDEETRHDIRRIDDAFALALGDLGLRLAEAPRSQTLKIGNRLLENASEDRDGHLAPVVPSSEAGEFSCKRVGDLQRVSNRIGREQAAIIGPDMQLLIANIDVSEKCMKIAP